MRVLCASNPCARARASHHLSDGAGFTHWQHTQSASSRHVAGRRVASVASVASVTYNLAKRAVIDPVGVSSQERLRTQGSDSLSAKRSLRISCVRSRGCWCKTTNASAIVALVLVCGFVIAWLNIGYPVSPQTKCLTGENDDSPTITHQWI